MSRPPHTSNPRLPLALAALSAGLFLAGCSGRDEPLLTQSGVVAAAAPSTGPQQSVASPTSSLPAGPVPTSPVPPGPRPAGTTAATSAAPPADLDQGLAGIDRDLSDLDHELTDADHDVATPEGDIR